MSENRLHDLIQSDYKPSHSAETALLHVQNNILSAFNKTGVFVAPIDLSAAFDMVDHQIIPTFLRDTFRV